MAKKHHGKNRWKDEVRLTHPDRRFAMLPEEVCAGSRYRCLGFAARALLVELVFAHNGANNGYLPFSIAWARQALRTSGNDTPARACKELIASGLVMVTIWPHKGVMRRVALAWLDIGTNTRYGGYCPVLRRTVRRPLDVQELPPWRADYPNRFQYETPVAGPCVGSPVSLTR